MEYSTVAKAERAPALQIEVAIVEQAVPLQLSVPSFAAERRVAVRFDCNANVTCRIDHVEHFDCRWARVVNVSVSGIGLCVSGRLEPGTRLTIQMSNALTRYASGLAARVVHSTFQEDGSWLAGCVFENALDEGELRELFL
jgi:hypothetical protein